MELLREFLKDSLNERKQRNPHYSLRSFARFLEISPAHLSGFLSSKRELRLSRAETLVEKFDLSLGERQRLLSKSLEKYESRDEELIEEDHFNLIADWYHYAILGLAHIEDNSHDTRWIASKLKIDLHTAHEAFNRLVKLGLVKREGRNFRQIPKEIKTSNDISSKAIRKYHAQNLSLAINKIQEVDVNKRDYSAITMTIDGNNLKRFKDAINNFKQEIMTIAENSEGKDVYTISTQLFPLTEVKDD